MGKIKNVMKKLLSTGFFSVFGSNILIKMISFCSGMFIVRLLTKSDYGLYTYVNNIVSMIMIVDGLGTITAILQFCSENADNKPKMVQYERYGLGIGLKFNGVVCIVLLLVGGFFNFQFEGAREIMMLSAITPLLTYLLNYIAIVCRTRLLNHKFSTINVTNSILSLVTMILGALAWQVKGVVVFRMLGQIATIFIAVLLTKSILFDKNESSALTLLEKKEFWKISLISCANNALSQILVLLDVFIVGIILPNTEIIAAYKTATTIPFAMLFIPISLMIYCYPHFARNNKNRAWVKKNTSRIILGSAALNVVISTVIYILAPFIIKIIFGDQYGDSVAPFRVLMIFFFFNATFRIPIGNILVSQKKVTYNLIVSILSGALNIISNIFFILKFGSIGAAYSTLLIGFLSGIIDTLYFYYLLNRKLKPSRKGKTPFEIYELEQASAKLSEATANGD